MAQSFGAEIKEAPQIVGRKDGQDVYRVTYSARLPEYRAGDVVEVEGTYYLVDAINGHFIMVRDIVTMKKKSIDTRRHGVGLVREKKDIEKMLVIYQSGDTVQLLSKDNRVREAKVSRTLENGVYVSTITIDDNIYVLP
jgi:nonsense-mediated mRNA decay protein 3